jgi:hypothetical protein
MCRRLGGDGPAPRTRSGHPSAVAQAGAVECPLTVGARLCADAPPLPSLRCPRARVHHHTSSATRIKRGTQSAGEGAVLSAHRRRTRGVTSQMPLTAARHLLPCPCTTAAAALEEVLSR